MRLIRPPTRCSAAASRWGGSSARLRGRPYGPDKLDPDHPVRPLHVEVIANPVVEKAGSRDPAKLRDVLATTEFTNLPLPATKIKFGSNGLNEYGTGVLAEWIKGEIRTVWPKENQAIQPLF